MGNSMETTKKRQISAGSRTIPPYDWNGVIEAEKRASARKQALNRSSEFFARCVKHGETLFDAETGACLNCLSEPSELPARVRYLSAYAISYPATCEIHGETLHGMTTNKCLRCFTGRGRLRSQTPRNEARIAARAAGDTSYAGVCEVHGAAPHHTIRGKCRRCFNSLGYPRKVTLP